MNTDRKEQARADLEQLTSAIREMANRASAQFVVDTQKSESFAAAGEQREKFKKTA